MGYSKSLMVHLVEKIKDTDQKNNTMDILFGKKSMIQKEEMGDTLEKSFLEFGKIVYTSRFKLIVR